MVSMSKGLKTILRSCRDLSVDMIAYPLSYFIRILPIRIRTKISTRIKSTGALDYPSASIRMCVESPTELGRLRSCIKEPGTVAWLDEFMGPDDILYDIGANVGAYSLIAAARIGTGNGMVVSFEPSFRNFVRLNENIELNGFSERVIPVAVALADVSTIVTFQFSSREGGAALHNIAGTTQRTNARQPVSTSKVLAMPLSDLVEKLGLPHPTLIKLDVDGPEFEVLKGAGSLLGEPALKTILVEVEPDPVMRENVRELLEGFGWTLKSRNRHYGNAVDEDWIWVRAPGSLSV